MLRRSVHCARRCFSTQKLVLGLESSADDTCASVVADGHILSNVVLKQSEHEIYGGIVPQIASARHGALMPMAISKALEEADVTASQLDAIAYTRGPGLAPCLRVCTLAGQTLAAGLQRPSIAVHHMAAHALTVLLTNPNQVDFPFLCLLVSGGHTMLVLVRSIQLFRILATTLDTAIGNCIDHVARAMSLPWDVGNRSPGAALEAMAARAGPARMQLPRVMPSKLAFSFSGLQSATERLIAGQVALSDSFKTSLAASFQECLWATIIEKVNLAVTQLRAEKIHVDALVCSGGVAANSALRQQLATLPIKTVFPPAHLCTDNAVMIAHLGLLHLHRGVVDQEMGLPYLPKWSLEEV